MLALLASGPDTSMTSTLSDSALPCSSSLEVSWPSMIRSVESVSSIDRYMCAAAFSTIE